MASAAHMMALHGRQGVTLRSLAGAVGMSPMTIKRMFCDMDSILGEILGQHLRGIAAKFGELPSDSADTQAARRAAYVAYTRTGFGGPTEHHLLLMRDRFSLPADLAEPLEALRQSVGDMMAYPNGAAALALLDCQGLALADIEAMLAACVPDLSVGPAAPAGRTRETLEQRLKLPAPPAHRNPPDEANGTAGETWVSKPAARKGRLLN